MTREELCIHACKYAIGELARKGSSAFITSAHEGRQQISWEEVMEWLDREQCEDAISREDAINALKNLDDLNGENVFTKNGLYPWNILKELPSVQPKYSTSEWCHDCKEYNKDKHCCPRFNNVIRKTVEEMKQQKIKVGHWIHHSTDDYGGIATWYECSECGRSVEDIYHVYDEYPYCHCGARMIEPQERSDKE